MSKNFLEIENVTFAASNKNKVSNLSLNIEKVRGDLNNLNVENERLARELVATEKFLKDSEEKSTSFNLDLSQATETLKKVNEQIKEAETEELTAQKESLEKKKGEYRMEQLKAMEWKSLWMFPAIFAAGVLGIFLLLFRDKTGAETEAKQA